MFGVGAANTKLIAKQAGADQALAEALWASGNHDARILATTIADGANIKASVLDKWAGASENYVIADAVSGVIARGPNAAILSAKLRVSKKEFRAAIGWNVVSSLAHDVRLTPEEARSLLEEIEAGIHAAPNRARHSMNSALIAIGLMGGDLEKAALAAAKRIGVVVVDHGQTGCNTYPAADYIAKARAHAATRREKNAREPAKRQ